jgi:hypothetical protein
MSNDKISTRRRFFVGAGAVLAAPAAVAARGAGQSERGALEARLAALEDERAIRELRLAYARHVNARAFSAAALLFADPADAGLDSKIAALADDAAAGVEIAADRQSAVARGGCVIEIEEPIAGPGCTLVDMARAQGEGVLRHVERRELTQTFVRRGGVWKIERVSLRDPAAPA